MSKGNVIIGQSGGPTAVINSSLAGAIKAARLTGIEHIYGMHHGIEGFLREDIIDMDDYLTDLHDLSLLKRTPSSFLGTCRYKLPDADGHEALYEQIVSLLEKYDIRYFLYIGGNDSMDTVMKLADYAKAHHKFQHFVGIPKTIDNDLPVTDHCPGYGSAAKYVGTTMKELIRDNGSYGASKPRICVVEIMGRNAGWLTAASALAHDTDCSGPDLICLPERPFDPDDFLARTDAVVREKNCVVIAVSEGLRIADGTPVCNLGTNHAYVDAFGHQLLSGCSRILANRIGDELGYDTRAIEFSVMQRCAAHLASRTDLDEAYNAGFVAFEKAYSGANGIMVTMKVYSREPYVVSYEETDVHNVADIEKKVPDAWITEDGYGVTQDFIRYVEPLVHGAVTPYYAAGLPKHMSLLYNKRR